VRRHCRRGDELRGETRSNPENAKMDVRTSHQGFLHSLEKRKVQRWGPVRSFKLKPIE
jgi:hypothetical protein